MRRTLAFGMAAALTFGVGCSDESGPEKTEGLPIPEDGLHLTVQYQAFPWDPEEAGPKGSGDLGQSEKPLKVGATVVAKCLAHREDDEKGLSDAVVLTGGEFDDQHVALQVYPQLNNQPEGPIPVFDLNPDEIRSKLERC